MTTSSRTVILVVISILAGSLFYSSVSTFHVFAKPRKSSIECFPISGGPYQPIDLVECCQTTTYDDGLEIQKCTQCENTDPPSICSKPYTVPPRTTVGGVLPPPTGNNTITLPPGNIIKGPPISNATGTPSGLSLAKALNSTSPIIFRSAGNATNPTNNTGNSTAMKVARAYSPTGYCARNNPTTCLPCDPGLPGGKEMCIPTSQWPPLTSFPLAGNATSPGNNTGTITKVIPGIFKPIGNSTNALPPPTLLAKQPSSGHHHHQAGGQTSTSSSSSNSNSTGH